MDRVQAAVVSDDRMFVFLRLAVVFEKAESVRDSLGADRDSSAVAESSEIFGWKETEASDVPERPRQFAPALGAERLGAVFDKLQAAFFAETDDWGHVAGQPVEVHDQNGSGFLRDFSLNARGVDVVGFRIDVDEDGLCAKGGDCFDRREIGEGRGDHFVARADIKRLETEKQRIGSGIAGDGRCFEIRRQTAFEFGDFWPADELFAFDNVANAVYDPFLFFFAEPLRKEVHVGVIPS